MIHTCELCGNDFLTEADAYVVRPTAKGVKLYCYCQIKGFNEMLGAEATIADLNKKIIEAQNAYETLNAHDEMLIATVDKLKEENSKLVEALKFYANERYWEGREIDGDDWDDYYEDGNGIGGKLARQVLKEIGEE